MKEKCNGFITLGDKGKLKSLSIGKFSKHPTKSTNNIYFIDGLKFNLLRISQLCNKCNPVIFNHAKCVVKITNTGAISLTTLRYNDVYTL